MDKHTEIENELKDNSNETSEIVDYCSQASHCTKIDQIMSFLDKVETETEEDIQSTTSVLEQYERNLSLPFSSKKLSTSYADSKSNVNVTNQLSLATNVFEDVKSKMISLKEQLADKSKTIDLLKTRLTDAKTEQTQLIAKHNKTLKSELTKQKKEFDITTNRHLQFVDRLLSDKKALSNKCEELTLEIKNIEMQYRKKVDQLSTAHKKKIAKCKQIWLANEQIKRQEWISNKTKAIKTMTIKGLEPEIERLIEMNRKNMLNKESEKIEALNEQKQQLYTVFEKKQQATIDAMNQDTEVKLSQLIEKYEFKMNDIATENENKMKQEYIRLNKQFEDERQRLLKEKERSEIMHDNNVQEIINSHKNEICKLKELQQETLETEKRKHDLELAKYKEKIQIEKNEWQDSMKQKMKQECQVHKSQISKTLNEQQRKEIEIVVDKLVKENSDAINQLKQQHKQAVNELQKKLETQKNTSDKWIENYQNVDEKFKQSTNHIEKLEKDLDDLELQLIAKTKDSDSLQAKVERQDKQLEKQIKKHLDQTQNIRIECAEQISEINDKLNKVEAEKQNVIDEFDSKLSTITSDHALELETVEARIRQALCRKDDLISQLREQIRTKDLRINEIQSLLESHRNQLIGQM